MAPAPRSAAAANPINLPSNLFAKADVGGPTQSAESVATPMCPVMVTGSFSLTIRSVRGRKEAQVAGVGVAPLGVLDVVAVAVEGAVLARLTGEVDLDGAGVAQHGAAHVRRRQPVGDLVLVQLVSVGRERAVRKWGG